MTVNDSQNYFEVSDHKENWFLSQINSAEFELCQPRIGFSERGNTLKSSGMSDIAEWQMVTYVLNENNSFIFSVKSKTLYL